MQKDGYLIQEWIPENHETAIGYLCDFKLTPATDAVFRTKILPYIDQEVWCGHTNRLDDGRIHYLFRLDLEIGKIFMNYILATGRFLTREELENLNNPDVQYQLDIHHRLN